MPDKSKSRKENSVRYDGKGARSFGISSPNQRAGRNEAAHLTFTFFFISIQSHMPIHVIIPPIFRVGPPFSFMPL